jgi:hypothetical protein
MNNNFILKDDGKIYWIQDMPEPIEPSKAKWVVNGKTIYSYGLACKEYEKALQSAISNAVEVSNQEEVFVALARDNEWDDWYRCEGGVKEYMTLGAVYSLQCSVEKLELMRENDGNPVVHSVKALVTFPESGNNEELKSDPEVSEWLRTVDPVLYAVASAAINFARSPSGTKGKMFISKTVEQYASQQCSSLKEEFDKFKAQDNKIIFDLLVEKGRYLKRCEALEEALRKTFGYLPWREREEIEKTLNPTPKTEGTSI